MQKIINEIVLWMKDYLKESKKDGFVIGVSGGLDSSVLLMILNKYFKNKYIAYWIDVESYKLDYDFFNIILKNHKINYKEINLKKTYSQIKNDLSLNELNSGNVKSRLRMISLYAKAQEFNYLVVGTTNLNEYEIGYFTKYGDGASDISPIRDLLKFEIKEMAKILNVPEEIINREPSAGLYENQTDEKDIGISYKLMDEYFLGKKLPKDINDKISEKIKNSSHKKSVSSYPKFRN